MAENTAANVQNDGPTAEQDGGECPTAVCFQPQLIYGTYIALPPVFCRIDCAKYRKTNSQNMPDAEDDSGSNLLQFRTDSHHNGLQDDNKPLKQTKKTNKANEREKNVSGRDPRCPLKLGSFTFPAKNAMYHPRQSLEGTVLELYKKESYPYNKCQMRKC